MLYKKMLAVLAAAACAGLAGCAIRPRSKGRR